MASKLTNRAVTVAVLMAAGLGSAAAGTRPWDRVSRVPGQFRSSSSTVATKAGNKYTGNNGLTFSNTGVTIDGTFIPRGDVKEITIRQNRGLICCDGLALGLAPLYFAYIGLKEDSSPKNIFAAIPLAAIGVATAAVTGPPFLAIEGISHLRPAKVIRAW